MRGGATEAVLRVVANAYGVSVAELIGRERGEKRISDSRHVAMYLLHITHGLTYKEIGRQFGRTQTTVSRACANTEDRRETRKFDELMYELEASCELGRVDEILASPVERPKVATIKPDRRAITRPPGHLLVKALRVLVSSRTFDRVFAQIILDARDEYFLAVREEHAWVARLRHLQLWLSVLVAISTWITTSAAHRLYTMWKTF